MAERASTPSKRRPKWLSEPEQRAWRALIRVTSGVMATLDGELRIGRIDEMDAEDVSETDAKRAGFNDVADFRRWLGTMKEGPLFHRIEISWLGERRPGD